MTTPENWVVTACSSTSSALRQHALADHQGAVVGDLRCDRRGTGRSRMRPASAAALHGPVPEELLERAAADARDVAKKSVRRRRGRDRPTRDRRAGRTVARSGRSPGRRRRPRRRGPLENEWRVRSRPRSPRASRAEQATSTASPTVAGQRDCERAVARRAEPLLDAEDAVERSGVGLLVSSRRTRRAARPPPR